MGDVNKGDRNMRRLLAVVAAGIALVLVGACDLVAVSP